MLNLSLHKTVMAALLLTCAIQSRPVLAASLDSIAHKAAKMARKKNFKRITVLQFTYPGGKSSPASLIIQEQLAALLSKEEDIQVVDSSVLAIKLNRDNPQLPDILSIPEDETDALGIDAVLTGILNDISKTKVQVTAKLVATGSGIVVYAREDKIKRTWADSAITPREYELQNTTVQTSRTDARTGSKLPSRDARWVVKFGDYICAVPSIAEDGTIYIPSSDKSLYALNPDGTLKWRFDTEGEVRTSPSIATDGTIYIGSYDGRIYAVRPDGKLKWSYDVGSKMDSSPALDSSGIVYIGAWNGRLYAMKPDGTIKWSFDAGYHIRSSPVLDKQGNIYCATANGAVFSVTTNGRLRWKEQLGETTYSSPAPGPDQRIYIGVGATLYAFSNQGKIAWKFPTKDQIYAPPVVGSDGTVYIGSWDNSFYAVNANGRLKWEFRTDGPIRAAAAVSSDGTIYVGSYDQIFYALNPDGTQKWAYTDAEKKYDPAPAIAPDGTIYVGNSAFTFHAIAGDKPLSASACPKFRCDLHNTGRPQW